MEVYNIGLNDIKVKSTKDLMEKKMTRDNQGFTGKLSDFLSSLPG